MEDILKEGGHYTVHCRPAPTTVPLPSTLLLQWLLHTNLISWTIALCYPVTFLECAAGLTNLTQGFIHILSTTYLDSD
jgi:hypothetical protein